MNEQDKQIDDQQKKHQAEKERKQKKSQKNQQSHSEPQAGMSTDPATMKDKNYVQRIDEKTSKH